MKPRAVLKNSNFKQIQGQDKITYAERKQYEAGPRIQSPSFILKPS